MSPGRIRRRSGRLAVVSLLAGVVVVLGLAGTASAHPLGNFTSNHYTGVRVEPQAVAVRLVQDLAEIPAQQALPGINRGEVTDAVLATYADSTCTRLIGNVRVARDGEPMALTRASATARVTPGAAGLHTLRTECVFRSDRLATVGHRFAVSSTNDVGRIGWREITVAGDGVEIRGAAVPADSPSRQLTAYPADLLTSPLDQREADFAVARGSGVVRGDGSTPGDDAAAAVARALPRGLGGLTRSFTDLVGRERLGLGFGAFAALVAVLLGALHAFAPGHGKTVMAAYLVGERGSLRQALTIGLTVTATHTLGVLALGVALSSALVVAPERLYPIFGIVSGLLLAGVGLGLVRARRRGVRLLAPAAGVPGQGHDHGHGDHGHGDHGHGDHGHGHGHGHGDHGHGHGHGHGDHGNHDHGHGDHGHDHDHTPDEAPALPAPPRPRPGRPAPAGDVLVATAPVSTDREPASSADGVTHDHGFGVHTHAPVRLEASWRSLVAVGFAGGLVPSPSALVVLLGAIALGRAWFGVLLVLLYGAGMAATLTGTGVALARLRGGLARRVSRRDFGPRWARIGRLLPTGTAAAVVVLGVVLAARSALAL